MADFTIFYSWQTDAPEEINKKFIQETLQTAVDALGNDFEIQEADRITVEQGMKGVPGSPEVATIMFEKIGEAAIFLGDVSLVGAVYRDGAITKLVPNPNVSIEEGFAAGVLGWERVICVSNELYGKNEEQSFDQRNRRFPINYTLLPDASEEAKNAARKELLRDFKVAIRTVREFELRKAERVLEQLNVPTIELLIAVAGHAFLVRPVEGNPLSHVPALRELTLWDECLIRLQTLRIVRTNLGVDAEGKARYAYHWTAVGRKAIDLIIKKITPAAAAQPHQ